MNNRELLLYYMEQLQDVLGYYLNHPFDEDMHMKLNDLLLDTFDAMHQYFYEQEGGAPDERCEQKAKRQSGSNVFR